MVIKYRSWFSKLNVAQVKGYYAPHKAILLLAIIERAEYGLISENRIGFTKELQDACSYIWDLYIGVDTVFRKNYSNPFWYMKSEPFWKLFHKGGSAVSNKESKPSDDVLAKDYYAVLDEELFNLLKAPKSRAVLRTTLITKYLGPINLGLKQKV